MNSTSLPRLCLLLAITVSFSGCANMPWAKKAPSDYSAKRSSPATELAELNDQITKTNALLNSTLGNLARLPNSGVPAEAFAAFSQDQAAFAKAARSLLASSAKVRNNGHDYFIDWSAHTADIKTSEIKEIAEQRRLSLEKSYNAMLTPLVSARADLTSFIAETNDIRTALTYDQTDAGVAALKGLITRSVTHGETAMESLNKLQTELTGIIALLPPPPSTK